jgi:hypothetical protein
MKDMCECGEARYWHSGHDYSGKCIKRFTLQGDEHKVIHCNGFKKEIKITVYEGGGQGSEDDIEGRDFTIINRDGSRTEYKTCLGCRSSFDEKDMVSVCGHLVCKECNTEAIEEHDDDEFETELADRSDREEILQVAAELGLKPAFVEYLLFEAEDHDFDQDPWLIQIYCAVDDAYSTALRQGEDAWRRQLELDAQAFTGCEVPLTWICRPCEKSVYAHNCPECGRDQQASEEVARA